MKNRPVPGWLWWPLWVLAFVLLTAACLASLGCLSTIVGTGRNVHAAKMVKYTAQCVNVPAPAPGWCDDAEKALDELRAADQAAQATVDLKGNAGPQRKRLNDAIEAVEKIFAGR